MSLISLEVIFYTERLSAGTAVAAESVGSRVEVEV
jgi:hypothetical protein